MTRPTALAALVLVLAAAGAPGCKSIQETYASAFLSGETLSYERYLSIGSPVDPHPSAQDVLDRLGKPADVQLRDGARWRLVYHAFGLDDRLKRAEFVFDEDERLTKKDLW